MAGGHSKRRDGFPAQKMDSGANLTQFSVARAPRGKAVVSKDRIVEVFTYPVVPFTRFRSKMTAAGFTISGKDHPICPVMLGDARLASVMAEDMLNRGDLEKEQTHSLREGTVGGGVTTSPPSEGIPT